MTQSPQPPIPPGSTSATKATLPHEKEPIPVDDPKAGERKKARDDAEKANDELIKKYLEETAQGDSPEARKKAEQLAKDQEKARILNQIYNEKFAPGVRKTPAQENAEKAEKELTHK